MISYAGTPLLIEDPAGQLAQFLSTHLSLEQLNLFGPPSHISDGRGSGQGNNSHVMGLPVPNYPPAPPLRINTLYWPTGAMRFSTFIGLATDSQLEQILATVEASVDGKLVPGQLAIADSNADFSSSGTTRDRFTVDAEGRTIVSAEMWLLTPRKISGMSPSPPASPTAPAYERLWLLPLVDVRYFWQVTPTPSWLYGNVRVTSASLTSAGLYEMEFIGTKKRMPISPMTITGAADDSITSGTTGSDTINETRGITIGTPGAPLHTFTLTLSGETTEPIYNDALPEEIEDALGKLPSLQVQWQTLLNNCELILQQFDNPTAGGLATKFRIAEVATDTIPTEWGWPDRTELDRRHESIAAVLDAVAHSIGRRVVRDITGEIRIEDAKWAKTLYDLNLLPAEPYHVVAGGESLPYRFTGATLAPTGIGKLTGLPTGPYVPEAVDVVFRDLTRGSKITAPLAFLSPSGHLSASGGSGGKWQSDAGFLICSVKPSEAIDDSAIATWSLIAPANARTVAGWRKTIHTPSLNNFGEIPIDGDAYSLLALFIAGSICDWSAYVYDWDFAFVKRWQPTGFDDFVEWSMGERLPGESGYRAETRVQSLPFNFGVSTMLIQIGTQCPWTENLIQGELREPLYPALHPRLYPSAARAWAFLPPMTLQGEDDEKLRTHRRPASVLQRSSDAHAELGTYFQAHGFFCDKSIVWLDCAGYCGRADWSWDTLGGAWQQDSACYAGCQGVAPSSPGMAGDIAQTACIDEGAV